MEYCFFILLFGRITDLRVSSTFKPSTYSLSKHVENTVFLNSYLRKIRNVHRKSVKSVSSTYYSLQSTSLSKTQKLQRKIQIIHAMPLPTKNTRTNKLAYCQGRVPTPSAFSLYPLWKVVQEGQGGRQRQARQGRAGQGTQAKALKHCREKLKWVHWQWQRPLISPPPTPTPTLPFSLRENDQCLLWKPPSVSVGDTLNPLIPFPSLPPKLLPFSLSFSQCSSDPHPPSLFSLLFIWPWFSTPLFPNSIPATHFGASLCQDAPKTRL